MEKNKLNEDLVKNILNDVLLEEMSKVSRQDFSRVQFKIEELENSMSETLKELRKLNESIPSGLKGMSNARILGISTNLSNANKLLQQLKGKIRDYKKSLYSQNINEKKK